VPRIAFERLDLDHLRTEIGELSDSMFPHPRSVPTAVFRPDFA
jgi:hypothetical protein